jgi:hypothetical protein
MTSGNAWARDKGVLPPIWEARPFAAPGGHSGLGAYLGEDAQQDTNANANATTDEGLLG